MPTYRLSARHAVSQEILFCLCGITSDWSSSRARPTWSNSSWPHTTSRPPTRVGVRWWGRVNGGSWPRLPRLMTQEKFNMSYMWSDRDNILYKHCIWDDIVYVECSVCCFLMSQALLNTSNSWLIKCVSYMKINLSLQDLSNTSSPKLFRIMKTPLLKTKFSINILVVNELELDLMHADEKGDNENKFH